MIISLKLSLVDCLHVQNRFVILLLTLIVFAKKHIRTSSIGLDLTSVLYRELFSVCKNIHPEAVIVV